MGELPLVGVQCDLLFGAALQKLSDMVGVLGCVTVIDDDVIYNPSVACESSEGFVHPAVVVLRYGGDPVWCATVLESPKRCNERCQELALLVQRALVVFFEGIELREDLGFFFCDVSYSLGWCC